MATRDEFILCGVALDSELAYRTDIWESELMRTYPKEGELTYLYVEDFWTKQFIVGVPLIVNSDVTESLSVEKFSPFNAGYNDYVREVQKHVENVFGGYVEPHLIMVVQDTTDVM